MIATRSVSARPCTCSMRTAVTIRPLRIAKPVHVVRATTDREPENTGIDASKMMGDMSAKFGDLTEKWNSVDNKQAIAIYSMSAIAVLWLSTTIVSGINQLPLLPKFMELIGLGYSAWFTYRYLLFKSSREELIRDIEAIKSKIGGSE